MGKRNYLIEGVSGTGKTSVCTELQRRGYQAIHGDRELRYQGNPDALTSDLHLSPLWDIEKVQAFIANKDEAVTFFCGASRNFPQFIELLDGVFILDVDLDTCLRRIDERVARDPTDWGGRPEELETIVRLHQTKGAIPTSGVTIDATRPLVQVVDDILTLTQTSTLSSLI
ncbi:nucleoside kinase [Dictyobacter alpinus]|uniref:Nucleoside kinase n=1 Tax=Dictyobacter alpinus TaxID=2014873 RepID=A0A402B7Y7_9CHLR|nr:nucleoside kinase [Dictyobacter alpinus]GCE27410.1 nucleoside kinase [Dictyobacter alpinus]